VVCVIYLQQDYLGCPVPEIGRKFHKEMRKFEVENTFFLQKHVIFVSFTTWKNILHGTSMMQIYNLMQNH